jgi:hypothetical protein
VSDVVVAPAFVSTFPDSGDTTKFGPNAWNAGRLFSGGTVGQVLVRDPASATGASWSPVPAPDLSGLVVTTRTVNGHALSADVTVSKADVGLSAVENTALSTWGGSGNLTTVGLLATLTVTAPIVGSVTGAAGAVAASAITGATLAANVLASSLTSLGTLTSLGIKTLGAPVVPLHVGNSNTNNSSDSQILISRAVDDGVAGNGHAFSDSSTITRSGGIAYNSFDARIVISGTQSYDHYAAFQVGPTLSTSGTITNLYGMLFNPIVGAGTLTNSFGAKIQDPTGAGAVTNNYGLYIDGPLVKGTALNYAIYTLGSTPSFFGGNVSTGGTFSTAANKGATIGGSFVASAAGPHAFGGAASATYQVYVQGAFTPSGLGAALAIESTLTGEVNSNIYGLKVNPTLVEAASGVHGLLLGSYFRAPTVTAGAATVTNTATVYIGGAMTATVTGVNYALWSVAGVNRFGGSVITDAAFGCNGAAAQTPVASGGALAAYVTGAFGLDSTAHMQALFNQVVAIRSALVANGIMS